MNAAGDNNEDMNGDAEASATNDQIGEIISNPPHNDCGKRDGPTTVNGARPKIRHLCNISNGISPHTVTDDAVKVNNNLPVDKTDINLASSSNASSTVGLGGRINGLHFNCNNGLEPTGDIDSYLRNNVNCCTSVEKCPLKVRDLSRPRPSRPTGNNVSGQVLNNETIQNDRLTHDRNIQWGADDESSSSDTGNEAEDGLSADECCIYTYKGGQMADLPSSFFKLDAGGGDQAGAVGGRDDVDDNNAGRNSRSSSPEMDFLEMDFDPGPSCEQDSGEDSECGSIGDEEVDLSPDNPHLANGNRLEDEEARNDLNIASSRNNDLGGGACAAMPMPSTFGDHQHAACPHYLEQPPNLVSHRPLNCRSNSVATNDLSLGQRTTFVWGHHTTSGDLCAPPTSRVALDDAIANVWKDSLEVLAAANIQTPGEDLRKSKLNSTMFHCMMAERLVGNTTLSSDNLASHHASNVLQPTVERTMIWSENEACAKQVTQISTSACGATAVINTLVAMNITFELDRVKEGVGTRLRLDKAPLSEYLFSRSVAGATHVDIIRGLTLASEGAAYARFFRMYPHPSMCLTAWLSHWMKKGAVPIATLNLQQGVVAGSIIPDAWHHQMVFGVGPEGVYLSNPLEYVRECTLWPQLASPSVLLVRRADIIERWNQDTDLRPLMRHPDIRWKRLNVLGQVVNVIREWTSPSAQSQGHVVTQHVTIPAAYSSGITLAIGRESPAYEELRSAPELV